MNDPRMELVYFWSAILIVLTPVIIFGGIGVWVVWKYLRERKSSQTRNADVGTRN